MIRLRIVTWKTLRGRLPSAMRWLTYASFFFGRLFLTLRQEKLLQGVWWEILWGYRENWSWWKRMTTMRKNTRYLGGMELSLGGKLRESSPFFWKNSFGGSAFLWWYPTCFSKLFGNGWWLFCYFVGHFNLEFVLGTSKKKRTSSESVWSNYSDVTQPHPKM